MTEQPIDFDSVERELQKVADYKDEKQEKYLEKRKKQIEKEKIKEENREMKELQKEVEIKKGVEEGKLVQFPTKSGTLYMEKWIIWIIVSFFVLVLLFGVFTAVFGYSAIKDKFKSNFNIDQPINNAIYNNITPPACPACPVCSLDCGNLTYNVTLNPTFNIELNSS